MKESIKETLDAGFIVETRNGAYMRKEEDTYLYQTSYKSSNYGDFEELIDEFIANNNEE